jgi:hypothetical protein
LYELWRPVRFTLIYIFKTFKKRLPKFCCGLHHFVDPGPYPDLNWTKILDPYTDPDWSQSGSTTLLCKYLKKGILNKRLAKMDPYKKCILSKEKIYWYSQIFLGFQIKVDNKYSSKKVLFSKIFISTYVNIFVHTDNCPIYVTVWC